MSNLLESQNFLWRCLSCLSFLYNYFDNPTKLFFVHSFCTKFLDISEKFFPCNVRKYYSIIQLEFILLMRI